MKVLIIEDEKPAAKRLVALLLLYDAQIEIVGQLDTVKKSTAWFQKNPAPDVTFMDIQLADGLSFDIFEEVEITSPVIFTTAYDQYAVQAFKVNSVDYLLKPIDPDELSAAINKFKSLHFKANANIAVQGLQQIQTAISMISQPYKHRFVVKVGEHIKAIPTEDVLYFIARKK